MNQITRQATWLLTLVTASLVLFVVPPVLALAADPAIAFTTSDFHSLIVMNADGTNQKVLLTASKKSNVSFGAPNWSPDGTQLVFGSNVQGSGIYIINKDGTGLHKVIAVNDWFFNDAVWSPVPAADGLLKIAFADSFPGQCGWAHDLFIVNLDGSGLTNLTNSQCLEEYYPTWDQYATRLAGQSSEFSGGSMHLYKYDLGLVNGGVAITSTADLTATGPLQNANIYKPDWAKTQDKIVVEARLLNDINNSALWVVTVADPANPLELTATYAISAIRPSWSPLDSQIVFQRNGRTSYIYKINPNGSGLLNLGVVGAQPDWRRNP
jgi:Tol biopolymer transport system component